MPDLGNRANVMGPQPIGPIKQPEAEMMAAIDRFLAALMAGKKEDALAMTLEQARDRVNQIADSVKPRGYDSSQILGKARVAEHYFVKAKLTGGKSAPYLIQFRMGPDGDKWTVREVADLSNVKSAWTK
jgi:hypothetical protein